VFVSERCVPLTGIPWVKLPLKSAATLRHGSFFRYGLMLRGFWQDLRLAVRVLGKSRGFTALAVAILGLGIGATTAVFSGINAVLFRPIQGAGNAERLLHISIAGRPVAYVEYEDLQARTRNVDLAAYFSPNEAEWRVDGQLQTLAGEYVSGNYFHVLGVSAAVGRVLEPGDERPSSVNAVVVSDGLWREYFRSDPTVVGRPVTPPDWRVFVGTLLVSLLVGVVCGLTTALRASKTDLTSALKNEAELERSGVRLSWRNALVAAQVAGALVLIAASGLFLRSERQALKFDPGFDARQLAFTRVELPRKPDAALTRMQVYRDLQARIAALPDVQAVSMSDGVLLEGTGYRDGHKLQVRGQARMPFGDRVIGSVIVGPEYFKTIALPLALGRDFTERDRVVSSRVVIVNEALAQRAFPGENPVGRHIRLLPRLSRGNVEDVEIVGVVQDAAHSDLGQRTDPILYRPLDVAFLNDTNRVVFLARTRNDPDAVLRTIASAVGDLGPDIHVYQSTLAGNIRRQALPLRITSAFFGLFGGLGLLLAAVGLSGQLSYAVARRTREIGVRMALGADRAAVVRTVIGEGALLTLAGVVAGLLLASVLTRGLGSFLFGVGATDPLTYFAASMLLMLIAPVACYIPARCAASVDPLIALRHD
jgi:hypothetical protein